MTKTIGALLLAIVAALTANDVGSSVCKIYWTGDSGAVRRANPDGSNVEVVLDTSVEGSTYGIALDQDRGKLYFTEQIVNALGRLRRADLNGSGTEFLVPPSAMDPLLPNSNDIALDLAGGKVYWGSVTTPGTGEIHRADLDGTNVETPVSGLGIPRGIALAGGKMYWTDESPPKIQRADFDGTNVEDVISSGLSIPDDIAFDLVAGKMYFTDAGAHVIRRANSDGTDLEDLVSGITNPQGIALDVDGRKMYWVESVGGDKVRRANLDGTGLEDLVTTGLLNPRKIALRPFDEACRPDADADGEPDAFDRCPGTPPNDPVDEAGCSLTQFCAGLDVTTRDGVRACKRADWRNDEPLMRRSEADCMVDRAGPGSADDRCIPAVP